MNSPYRPDIVTGGS